MSSAHLASRFRPFRFAFLADEGQAFPEPHDVVALSHGDTDASPR